MNQQTAKIFTNGRSQAVRLPKEFRFNTSEVYIRKVGDEVVISAKKPTWKNFFNRKSTFGDDFLAERDNDFPQERESF
ncbi:MAG: type II toxin-antitoxin system VapB family antitoxin [Thiotrichaceae bacterium]